jgi:hypothetical protein
VLQAWRVKYAPHPGIGDVAGDRLQSSDELTDD